MDKLTQQQRHANMAAIHSKDTKPEMIVRRGLWSRGFRYRLNYKRLPGHPDLVLRKYRTCIFVNGCFWHGHNVTESQVQGSGFKLQGSECCKIPKTNRDETLDSIAFTLNHIWLQDHGVKTTPYSELDEEDMQMTIAAENNSYLLFSRCKGTKHK